MKNKNKETDVTLELLKIARNYFDALSERIEIVGFMANPDMGKKILDDRKAGKTKEDIESGEDELMKFAREMEGVPETLMVEIERPTNEQRYFLPKYKRKLGIDIEEPKPKPKKARY